MSDHIAELNERPKLGGGDGGVNVALWSELLSIAR